MAAAGVLYLVLSIVAKFIKIHKDQKVRDSISGIIAWILALAVAIPAAGTFKNGVAYSLAEDIPFVIVASVSLGALLNLKILRNLISKIPAVVRLAYQNLFRYADSNETKVRSQKKLVPLKEGTVDAMICCCINHDKIMQYLSTTAREQLIKDNNNKISEIQKSLQDCSKLEANLEEQKKKVLIERQEMDTQNQETDARLRKQLEEIDRRYGADETPDFARRSNLLAKDVRGLADLEQKFDEIGLTSCDVSSRDSAIKNSNQFVAGVEKRLAVVRNEIDKNGKDIKEWMDSSKCPPEKNMQGQYRYRLDNRLCVCNSVDMDDKRPVVIEHDGRPVVFRYKGECSLDRMVDFISELWNGFARIAPANLVDMFVVDSAKSVKFTLKKRNWTVGTDNVRNRFARNYQEGYERKVDAISNDQQQSTNEAGMRGVFEYNDINNLMKALEKHQDSIETYGGKNPEGMMKAQEIIGSGDSISLVNYCRGGKGSGHDMEKYQIVIFVVPEKDTINAYNDEAMDRIRPMLEADVARIYGILPIFITPEHSEMEKWNSFVALAEQLGSTYSLDMSSLRIRSSQ